MHRIIAKEMAPKSYDQIKKKESDLPDLSQKKIQKVLMKFDEMGDVFLNLANFANLLNLKTLTEVSKVS